LRYHATLGATRGLPVSTKPILSIYDLASNLGVSASTVSRVLNQRGRIAPATRKRVLDSARAAGFRPRMTARQRTIALVMDRQKYASASGFIPLLISSLVGVLSRQEVSVELFTEQNLNRLHDRHIDGVLAMAWDDATIDVLRGLSNVPVVTLNRVDVPEFSAVATDHRADGEMAVDHLYAKGHRVMAMLCEERENWGSRQRTLGFFSRIKALGLPENDQLVAYTDHQPMYGQLRRLLAQGPTAIYVAEESLGIEALYILREVLNVKVPSEISIISMEAAKVSEFLSPPMTAIVQSLGELGSSALELLLQHIGGPPKPVQLLLKNRLIERESVATLAVDAPEPAKRRGRVAKV
jgi:LacI family transcriptional regulator